MKQKIILAVLIIFITIIIMLLLINTPKLDKEILSKTFVVEAVYYESEGVVEILFEDRTNKTTKVILEILGMEKSFQKTFSKSSFIERVPFSSEPKYGWEIHPVTFVVTHEDFGKIGLKTEIHSVNESVPSVIYSIP